MIIGLHSVIYTDRPEEMRAFFRDILDLPSIDAGGGWLLFSLPPAELGIHPATNPGRHEFTLLCDNIETTVSALHAKGVEFAGPVAERPFGLMTALILPDGSTLGLCQANHPLAPGINTLG